MQDNLNNIQEQMLAACVWIEPAEVSVTGMRRETLASQFTGYFFSLIFSTDNQPLLSLDTMLKIVKN